jgi:hypothetical protein
MILYALILFFILISLFLLYSLSKNDFILLRKNITLHQVFNYAFISLFIAFLFGRLFYIGNSQEFLLFNPLAFLHFLKYPGFSLLGAFIGVIIILSILVKDKKALPRLFDIAFLSFFPFFSLSLLFIPFNFMYIQIAAFILSIIILCILLKFHQDYSLRDGSLFLVILMMIFLTSFIADIFVKQKAVIYIFSFLQLMAAVGFLFSIVFLIKNEFFKKSKS